MEFLLSFFEMSSQESGIVILVKLNNIPTFVTNIFKLYEYWALGDSGEKNQRAMLLSI